MLQKLANKAGVDHDIWPDPADRRAATNQLLVRAAGTTGQERREIEDLVVELNLQFAKDVARRYRGRGIDLDDLEQVACMGLVKAVQRFEVDKGREFLGFAVPTIRGELRRHFRDRAWMVRPPRSIQEMQAAINGAEEALVQELGRSPRPREIAEHLGAELDLVLEALGATGCYVPSSLDAPLSAGESTELGQMLGAPELGFESAEARAQLGPVLAALTERERTILELRFGQNRTQAEIGATIGVTQMQVSRLLAATLAKLRSALEPSAA
jgi:RNA polymerase sigma-B factor